MPVNYVMDVNRRLVVTRACGSLRREDMCAYYDALRNDPTFERDFSEACDFSDVATVELTGSEIRKLAKNDTFAPDARRAILATRPVVYGVARMLASYREAFGAGHAMRVFRDLAAAWDWLHVPCARGAEHSAADWRRCWGCLLELAAEMRS